MAIGNAGGITIVIRSIESRAIVDADSPRIYCNSHKIKDYIINIFKFVLLKPAKLNSPDHSTYFKSHSQT